MLDFSDVTNFERRLNNAGRTEDLESDWKRDTGRTLAARMSATAPRRTGRLAASIHPTDDGVAAVDYYRFVEYGTVHMAPQPFIRPALRKTTPDAVDDLGQKSIRELQL